MKLKQLFMPLTGLGLWSRVSAGTGLGSRLRAPGG
jgi:hypothetical protein